jgi:cysteinyl-tRNA synthetase
MSWKHLGENFDIHGGGDDLIFPHHENEIAQSCCAFPDSGFANVWVHNRMLLVNGEKMSKSLGNFLVLRDVLGKAPGEAVRFLLIRAHYRSTLDFSDAALLDAKKELDRFYRAIEKHPEARLAYDTLTPKMQYCEDVWNALLDDLNTPLAISGLHSLADAALAGDANGAMGLLSAGQVLGLFNVSADEWFRGDADDGKIEALIAERKAARAQKNFARADEIRKTLEADGILLEDGPAGTTWRRRH